MYIGLTFDTDFLLTVVLIIRDNTTIAVAQSSLNHLVIIHIILQQATRMMLPFEDKDSWQSYNEERRLRDYHDDDQQRTQQDENGNDSSSMISLGNDTRILNKMTKEEKKRMKRLKKIRADPGIRINTMHGLMVDAGSSGSRMHVYQFEKRVLNDEREISEAVSVSKTCTVYVQYIHICRLYNCICFCNV